jgi:type II secretory pathway component PulF
LSEALSKRVTRGAHRFVMAFFPVAIFASGVLVAFIVFGVFMPLVTLLSELNR